MCNDPNTPTSLACIPTYLSYVINAAAILSGVASIFFIVIAGIMYISSGGDPIKVAKARSTVTYAIVGLVIIALTFVIMKVFTNITGAQCSYLGVAC